MCIFCEIGKKLVKEFEATFYYVGIFDLLIIINMICKLIQKFNDLQNI